MEHWLTWVWQFWSMLPSLRSIRGNYKDYISTLSDDILIDIFSRLPADSVLACGLVCTRWCYLTGSPHFTELNLTRATPVTFALLEAAKWGRQGLDGKLMPDMFIIEDVGKTTRFEKVLMEDDHMLRKTTFTQPLLVASCNGLLLFKYFRDALPYVICNPMTQEVIALSGDGFCGFFFDRFTKEYKFLQCRLKGNLSTFLLYRPRTKKVRKLTTSLFSPWLYDPCVNLPTALFWMAVDNRSQDLEFRCTQCIMMFNMDNEEFRVLPHPGNTCSSTGYDDHIDMRLLVMDEKLVFSDVRMSERLLFIWVLEDLVNYSWVKKYTVNLEGVMDRSSFFSDCWHVCPCSYDLRFILPIEVLNILNGELLLNWPDKGLFWYNLQFKTVRKIGIGLQTTGDVQWYPCKTVTYSKSLVSLEDFF